MNILALILAACSGIALAAQSPTNASLSRVVGEFHSSAISFSIGTLCMIALVAAMGNGDLSRLTEASPWQFLGGAYGCYVVFASIIATPRLGVALTMTASMLGQLSMSICIDAFGWLEVAPVAIGAERIVGCILVASGIALTYAGNKQSSSDRVSAGFVLMMVLAGVLTAIQVPTNASLSYLIGSLEATMISFTVGLVIIATIALVSSKGKLPSLQGARGWQFLGGAYGAIYVAFSIMAMAHLGANLTMATIMLGQILGGMAIDSLGLFKVSKIRMNARRVGGLAAILAGVAVISFL